MVRRNLSLLERRNRHFDALVSRPGLMWRAIHSAAGHDSRQLHYHCESGMIFIPCRHGISHNESEWTEPDQVAAGCRVLAEVLWELADGG